MPSGQSTTGTPKGGGHHIGVFLENPRGLAGIDHGAFHNGMATSFDG